MEYLEIIGPSLLRHVPGLIAWGLGIVLAVLMVRRGGGKAEKLFLAGCSLMFIVNLVSPLLSELAHWLVSERDMSLITLGLVNSLPIFILGAAGLLCLVLAFWMRFWRKREVLT